MKTKFKITPIKKLPQLILMIGLPLMAAVFSYILYYLLSTPVNERAGEFYTVCTMLEYAYMSLTLLICGALVVDMAT